MGIIAILIIILIGLLGFGAQVDDTCGPNGDDCPVVEVTEAWMPVHVDGVDGVIVAEGESYLFIDGESYWAPSVDDVTLAEAAIAAEQGDLQHLRQYAGFVENGERKIYVNGFSDAMGFDWYSEPVMVEDGGEAFFQAVFNVDTGELESFSFNGQA